MIINIVTSAHSDTTNKNVNPEGMKTFYNHIDVLVKLSDMRMKILGLLIYNG